MQCTLAILKDLKNASYLLNLEQAFPMGEKGLEKPGQSKAGHFSIQIINGVWCTIAPAFKLFQSLRNVDLEIFLCP